MMKREGLSLLIILILLLVTTDLKAAPGDYNFHFSVGPSLGLKGVDDTFRLAATFDYELDRYFGFDLTALAGFGKSESDIAFILIPSLKYDLIQFGQFRSNEPPRDVAPRPTRPTPTFGAWSVFAGAGFHFFNQAEDSGLALRLGTGLRLPLKNRWEFLSSANFFLTPFHSGSETPMTFDWLIGLGRRF